MCLCILYYGLLVSEIYVACSNIVEYEGGIVLVEETKPHIAGLHSLPGGSRKAGESDIAAAVRETKEETGLIVEPEAEIGRYKDPRTRSGNKIIVRVFASRVIGGALQTSSEHPVVAPYSDEEIYRLHSEKKLRSWIVELAVRDYRKGLRFDLPA